MKTKAAANACVLTWALIVGANSASAGVVISENFNSPTVGIDYVGSAVQTGFGGGSARLTPNANSQTGAIWSNTSFLFDSFSTTFDFIIGPSNGGGADGLTFTVLDAGSHSTATAIGGGGGGIGYIGLGNSFAVEFDTWNNGAIDGGSANHVGINQNGSVNSLARVHLGSLPLETTNLNNWHTAQVDMSSSGLLTVAINGTTYLSHTLTGYSNAAYFGFTGSTGGARDEHHIDNWTVSVAQAPEPTTLAILGLGLAGIGFSRRKRLS